ncbi:MAG: glycoside hydrolase family 3 C-terminal domain-containing protein [Bacilli bacterium]|nr:glycoside hydrolase family 3 C-terminal domain-containing protein [Bacilli bacterium]
MTKLTFLASFLDEAIFPGGYSIRAVFEYWYLGLIIIIVLAIATVGLYFLLSWLFGRMKFDDKDKETFSNYRAAKKDEKKEIAKDASKPVKNVVLWQRMKFWLIPVVCVGGLVVAAAASFLPSAAFKNLLFTMGGSHVTIYDTEASRKAAAEAEKNVVTIEEEGIVLLKNTNDSLPLKAADGEEKIKVNIFGSCAYGLFYGNGGSGSFQTDGRVSAFPRVATKLEAALVEEGVEINNNLFNMVKNYYRNKSVSIAESDYDIQCGFNKYNYSEIAPSKAPYDYEPPVSAYEKEFTELGGKTLLQDAKDFSDTAIFCITRRGSEDEDMNLSDLQLKSGEKEVIDMLEENFENVVILLNVPTVIESRFLDDDEIDSAVFIGHPGLTGATAVAEMLTGKINPSGHLVDTWPYDVTSAPSYQNFGNDTTLSHTGGSTGKFTDYLEGIYVGYRYYTTRGMVDPNYKYNEEVQYSFGHGLSYTTFDKSIVEFDVDKTNQKVTAFVDVKNTGNVAGKDVIQIYNHAPYTDGGIEKAWYSLAAFAKTNIIEPGETKTYKLEFTFRDIASWSTDKGYYILEKGDYEISLRENVWDVAVTTTNNENVRSFNLSSDINFTESYQTGKQYENIFQDVEWGAGEEPIEYLSRSDFEGTFTMKNDINRVALADKFPGGNSNSTSGANFTYEDNQIDEELPEQGVAGDLTLADMKEADWDDPSWDDLLSQMSIQDMEKLIEFGGFKTSAIASIGKEETKDYDGPSAAYHSGTGHPSEVVVGCSWSTDVARLMGESIGREGAARGLTGWYAPGINTHRSPFGGRNFEYYSEDPLIGGLMAGNTAQGALKYGVYSYAKHFICNDQENSRAGLFVWAKEQAIREIYARGFELYVDLGGLGIMSSFNCLGSWWCGASEALLTTLLREEWGFHGVVVTDYAGPDYMATNIGLRAGNDLWLTPNDLNNRIDPAGTYSATPHDATILMRRACKNILYACSRSNNVWTLEDYQNVGIEEIRKATDRS